MYFITGVSRGLGLAIARILLDKGEKVCGIGRAHKIIHPNFTFMNCDLSDQSAIKSLIFELPKEPITLINNAGLLGHVGRMSELDELDLSTVLQVNTVAPMELAIKIYDRVEDKNQFTLVNISSGAANRSIPSWGAYCASKAALNRLSENFFLEERERGNKPKVYAISPGVIDTDMQSEIRSNSVENFSSVQKFIELKEQSELFTADESARLILALIEKPYTEEVMFDVRN